MSTARQPTQREIASYLRNTQGMRCNCDLDSWEPERATGHSHVCRIHRAAVLANAALVADVSAAIAKTTGDAA